MRWLSITSLAVVLAAGGVVAAAQPTNATPAAVPAPFATASDVALPANAGSLQDADPRALTCPAIGTCFAVGRYVDDQNANTSFIAQLTSGTWSTQEAPVPADAASDPDFVLTTLACPSSSSCVAAGSYTATTVNGERQRIVVATLNSGSWTALGLSELPNSGSNPGPEVSSLSCQSASSCVAVGNYQNTSAVQTPFIATLAGSTWLLIPAPLPAGATHGGSLLSVACSSASSCAAVGGYSASSDDQGLIEWLHSGTWTAMQAPQPSDHAASPDAQLQAVSCPVAGTCVAVGSYEDTASSQVGLLETLASNAWTAQRAPLPVDAAGTQFVGYRGLSCTATAWCAAVTPYVTSSTPGIAADIFSGGAWSAEKVPAPSELTNQGEAVQVGGLSCARAGSCRLIGSHSGGGLAGLVIATRANGAWTSRLGPLPLDMATTGALRSPLQLSCAATSWCQGTFGFLYVGQDWRLAAVSVPGHARVVSLAAGTTNSGANSTYLLNVTNQTNGWHGLGTESASAPAVAMLPTASDTSSAPLFVATGADGKLYYRTLSSAWLAVQGSIQCIGGPAAMAIGTKLQVACQGQDHALHYGQSALLPGHGLSITNWVSLGGTLTGSPSIAMVAGHITFFVTSADGTLSQRTVTDGFSDVGTGCASPPASATSPDRMTSYVACTMNDGSVTVRSNVGNGWSTPTNLGGTIVGAPAIAANTTVPVFVGRGTTNTLMVRTASGWSDLGGTLSAAPTATALD